MVQADENPLKVKKRVIGKKVFFFLCLYFVDHTKRRTCYYYYPFFVSKTHTTIHVSLTDVFARNAVTKQLKELKRNEFGSSTFGINA